jgi:hypothetical protein
VLIGGGAAILVVVYALYKRSKAAAAPATSATTATPTAYNSTLTDMENQFENQIQGLQAQIAALQPTAATGTAAPTVGHIRPIGPIQGTFAPVPAGPGDPTAPAPVPYNPLPQAQALARAQAGNTLPGVAARSGGMFNNIPNR